MAGTLFVVATPLGNLEDLSPRALRILQQVDLIACEDTRHTGKMLAHFGVKTPTTSYHEHNEEEKSGHLLDLLRSEGKDIALVSDAGTPLISDPGFRLIRKCRDAEVKITSIPGPCAAIAALAVAGFPTDSFLFAGFLSRRRGARKEQLSVFAEVPATLVFYLSPHRLESTLQHIEQELGNRPAFLIREMTKLYETTLSGRLLQILEEVSKEKPRGEYTLVVEGCSGTAATAPSFDTAAYVAGLVRVRGLTRKEAIQVVARQLNLPKKEVYRSVVEAE